MKKIYSYMFAAVAMFAVVACEKENAGNDSPSQNIPADAIEKTSSAALVDEVSDDVKTVISGSTSLWSGTESISVLGKGKYQFTATLEKPSASATFTCSAYSASETEVMAVYPYSNSHTVDLAKKTVSNVEIPTTQYVVAGTYANDAHIAIAYSEDGNTLQFKNAVALFKFTVQQEGITKACLFASQDEGDCVSGTGTLLYNDGEPLFTPSTKKHWVDVYPEKGKTTFTKGGTYYFAVAPGVYANGFTFEVSTSAGNKNYLYTSKSQNLDAGLLFDLGNINLPHVPVVVGEFNNWTITKNPMTFVTDKYYVAKNITIAANQGFKILTSDKWLSVNSVATGKWYPFATESADMKLSAGTYDFYCDLKNEMLCIVKAGTTVPDFILFKPSTQTWVNSTESNYRFAIYFYNDSTGKNTWYSLNEKTFDGYYYASVEANKWPNLIICRMWGDNATNDWNTRREQTANLTMPTTNKRCFCDTSDWWSNQNDGWWNTKK